MDYCQNVDIDVNGTVANVQGEQLLSNSYKDWPTALPVSAD